MYINKFKAWVPELEEEYVMFNEYGELDCDRTNYDEDIDRQNIQAGNCFARIEDAMQWEDDVLEALLLAKWLEVKTTVF